MSDIHINTTTESGSFQDIYDLMRDLIKENPERKPKWLVSEWRNAVLDDPDMCKSACELAGRFVYNSVLSRKPGWREKMAKAAARAERASKRVSRHLFGMVMPNGKTLGRCTFGEVAKFSEGFARLAKLGRSNQIIADTITEAQARKAVLG